MKKATVGVSAIVSAAMSAVLLSSCTGHPAASTGDGKPSATASAPSEQAPPKPASLPTEVANDVAARKHVAMTGCAGDAKTWSASGTASNSGHSAVKYNVTVFYTTPKATVIGSSQTSVLVPANGQAKWTTSSSFQTSTGTRCVLRGVAVSP
jgi:hypothetical protein